MPITCLEYEQLCLFEMPCEIKIGPTLGVPTLARNCFLGTVAPIRAINEYEAKLIPKGKYAIENKGPNEILYPVSIDEADIPIGHQFYHYIIDGDVYAGIYVGNQITEDK